ncbi:MAG: sacsin N-terminal ATP-binding-like domain-containing protein [Halodesulfovibrio sp.]|uniref:sacsin N-terminal ATP-binding-like domain-containing protein n=1 Tax=Halodesulfovibrio sp. TaxID=1912772 RepID=UPI00359EF45F
MQEQEWVEWGKEKEARTIQGYRSDPDEFASACNREKEYQSDYSGRELLELLQNAHDAACEASEVGKVHIDLSNDGLIVANTGKAFSPAGVQSFRVDSLSPKREVGALVGSKGLGFRSVLNWSVTPIVFSKNLNLLYTEKVEQEKIKLLLRNQLGDGTSLPRLKFPQIVEKRDVWKFLDDSQQAALVKRAYRLREAGYATVVVLPLSCDLTVVREQLSDLSLSMLLFMKWIETITFDIMGERISWSRELNSDNVVRLTTSEHGISSYYEIHEFNGKIDEAYCENHEIKKKEYNIVAALPVGEQNLPEKRLYTFFETEEEFPYPYLLHVSLELESNRKRMKQSNAANEYILDKCVTCLAEIAEKQVNQDDKWKGLGLFVAKGRLSNNLVSYGWEERRVNITRKLALVPCLDGEFRTVEEAFSLGNFFSRDWIPDGAFSHFHVEVPNGKIYALLEELGIKYPDSEQLTNEIKEINFCTVEARAKFIFSGLQLGLFKEERALRSVFIIEDGTAIPSDTKVFFASSELSHYTPPQWANFCFISSTLTELLKEAFEVSNNRDLVAQLSPMRVTEYSLRGIIQCLVEKRVSKKNKRSKKAKRSLVALFHLYNILDESQKENAAGVASSFELQNQNGTYEKVSNLYLSKGYGENGELLQKLYGSFAKEKLLADYSLYFRNVTTDRVSEFFSWLGAELLPRGIETNDFSFEYRWAVRDSLPYPLSLGGYTVLNGSDWNSFLLKDVVSVDGIEEILEHASAINILDWISIDSRFHDWKKKGHDAGVVQGNVGYQRSYRTSYVPIEYYPYWLLQNTAWLPGNNCKVSPKKCQLGKYLEGLYQQPNLPKEVLKTYKSILIDCGVKTDFADLDWGEVYEMLLLLPERDKEGKISRKFYNYLLDSHDDIGGELDSGDFISEGKLWGKLGKQEQYFEPEELSYLSSTPLPLSLEEHVATITIPKRKNSKTIEEIFGVKTFDTSLVEYEVQACGSSPCFDSISAEFDRLKPYIWGLRKSQQSKLKSTNQQLKKLKLKLYTAITGSISYNENNYDLVMNLWDYFISDGVLYIRVDDQVSSLSDEMLAESIGGALALLFKIEDGSAYSSLISCRESNRLGLLNQKTELKNDITTLASELDVELDFELLENIKYEAPTPAKIFQNVCDQETGETQVQDSKYDGYVTVSPKLHIPKTNPKVKPKSRVVTGEKEEIKGRGEMSRSNGATSENKVIQFEYAEGRFPLLVEHLRGIEGAGCDIFSFESDEIREQYKATSKTELILRFIEVKGGGGRVDLTPNELQRAKKAAERYYLYRVNGNEVAVLQDPIGCREAVIEELAIYIDVERSHLTKKYMLHVMQQHDEAS